jgi:DNA-directed RNA polymerase specialized sigma24 family protein
MDGGGIDVDALYQKYGPVVVCRCRRLLGDEILTLTAVRSDLDAPLLLDRLLGRHPESTRTMAVLHFVDGMTLEQVARECGMSVSGVRKRLRGLRASSTVPEGR